MEAYYTVVAYVLSGIVGLCVGSFLNVVIYRVPNNMSVAFPASHCPKCDYVLKWYDNIPVVSYCILHGKCRSCGDKISFRYTAVEILNTVLWLASTLMFYKTSKLYWIAMLILSSSLICVSFIDLEHKIIPDRFQLIMLGAAVLALVADKENWLAHVIGGVACFLMFWLLGYLVGKAVGREALGGGDIKLAGVMGLFLGWQSIIIAMLAATFSSLIVIVISKAINKEAEEEFPFGPFLAFGFLIAAFFGDKIINAYITFLLGGLV